MNGFFHTLSALPAITSRTPPRGLTLPPDLNKRAICVGSAPRVILPLAMIGERQATLFHGRKTQKVVKDSVVQPVTVLPVLLGSLLLNVVSAL